MTWIDNLLRRATLRSLREGPVQVARAEALENDAKDAAERWQDYGFSGHPGDGQGLVLNAGGHTVVLRMDRNAERPELEVYEVAVWHKEGHYVKLKAGRVVEIGCDELLISAASQVHITSPQVLIDASEGVSIISPTVSISDELVVGGMVVSPVVAATDSLTVAAKELREHRHSGVDAGGDVSGPPV